MPPNDLSEADGLLPYDSLRSDAVLRAQVGADDEEEQRMRRGGAPPPPGPPSPPTLPTPKPIPQPDLCYAICSSFGNLCRLFGLLCSIAAAAALVYAAIYGVPTELVDISARMGGAALDGIIGAPTSYVVAGTEPTCTADGLSSDGLVLVGEHCWSLSNQGKSCAASCGSGAAVDAEATVQGSGDAAVQRALSPTSTTGGAGCGSGASPYGGLALLRVEAAKELASLQHALTAALALPRGEPSANVWKLMGDLKLELEPMLSGETRAWECVDDASFVKVGREYRSPCVCQSLPPAQAVQSVARAALIVPVATAVALALAGGVDYFSRAAPPDASAFSPDTAEPISLLNRGLMLLGSAAVLANVVANVLVIVGYATYGEWAFFTVAAVLLLAAAVVRAVSATGALYPHVDGLDFGSSEMAADQYVSRFGCSKEDARNFVHRAGRSYLLQNGFWPRKAPPFVAALLGLTGLSTPVQGMHDIFWRGRATGSFGEMKARQAVWESAPQLYIVLMSISATGLRTTLATQPVKIVAACLAAFMLAYGVASSWSNPLMPHRHRFYAGSLHRSQLLVAALLYVLSDVLLRGAAFSIVATTMTIPQALVPLALAYVTTLGGVAYAVHDGSGSLRDSKLLAAALQLLAPRVGDCVSSRYLWCDALVSTGVALLAGFGGISALDPGYVSGTAALLIGAAQCKLFVFVAYVLPARVGGAAGDQAPDGVADGTRPQHACANGSVWLARQYLDSGADSEVRTKDGRTLLHIAVEHGQLATARMLLEEPWALDVDEFTHDGKSPLWIACREGYVPTVQLLLEEFGAAVDHAVGDGRTPLYIACQNGHSTIARMLLDRGAPPNHTKSGGWTPLYVVCQHGYIATARLLLDRGAAVDQATNDGATPLHVACEKGHEAIAQLLLERGAVVVLRNNHGETALHVACSHGHMATARLLLKRGAAVDRANHSGATPLHVACSHGHEATARLLVQRGAVVDKVANDGATPLYAACRSGHETTAKLLLECGAAVNHARDSGATPLYVACSNGHAATVRLLLERGAAVNEAKIGGWTPLLTASSNGHVEAVRKLLHAGAKKDVRDADGSSALDMARAKKHEKVCALLV